MAASASLFFALLLSIISSSFLFCLANVSNNNVNGFTINLIHRDSPQSPLYNPNFTQPDRIKAAKMRSLARHRHHYQRYSSSPDDYTGPVFHGFGEYVIRYGIGTPPIETYAIIDTGSDLPWVQCLPCEKCYRDTGPDFDSRKSSSYKYIKCKTSECDAAEGVCYGQFNKCRYSLEYGDGGYSRGYLSRETLVVWDTKSDDSFPLLNMIFGCGVNNVDTPGDTKAIGTPGILGLSPGKLSFIRQISFDHFAHCFMPKDKKDASSPMTFGTSAIFEGARAPMKYYEGSDLYYLNVVGISVGNDSIPIPPGAFDANADGEGGFIIDSGATYSVIYSVVYYRIRNAVRKKTLYDSIKRDRTRTFDLCYDVKMSDIEFGTPPITLHFYGGTDLVLKGMNAWVDNGFGLKCLAMLSTPKGSRSSILGNHQQQNIYVGYNLKERYLTFKPTDCTKV